jgi:hypothetical protein
MLKYRFYKLQQSSERDMMLKYRFYKLQQSSERDMMLKYREINTK